MATAKYAVPGIRRPLRHATVHREAALRSPQAAEELVDDGLRRLRLLQEQEVAGVGDEAQGGAGDGPAISSPAATGMRRSCAPWTTTVGQVMPARRSQESERAIVAACCRRKPSGPTAAAMARQAPRSPGADSFRSATTAGYAASTSASKRPCSTISDCRRRAASWSAESARADVLTSARPLTRSGACRTTSSAT